MSKGAYTPELTPVARPGDIVGLDDGSEVEYRRVARYRAQPIVKPETITVSDGDDEQQDLDYLEVWDGWLGQFRPIQLTEQLPDDVTVRFDQGGNTAPLYDLVNQNPKIDNGDPYLEVTDDGDNERDIASLAYLYEQYVYEDTTPKVTVENTSGGEVDVDLTFAGWVFELDAVSESEFDSQPVAVPVESISGR